MTTRNLTTKFHEYRASEHAFAQLEQWTEENIVDGLLAPSYEKGDLELGFDSPKEMSSPQWVRSVKEFEACCDAVECELCHLSSLQHQHLLVTFNTSQEKALEQELRSSTTTVHESLRMIELVLSAPSVFLCTSSSELLESNAARSSRLNAQKCLSKRLLELSYKYHTMQSNVDTRLTHRQWEHTLGDKAPQKEKNAKQMQLSMLKEPWTIGDELLFLTEGTERRVLDHLDTRCPGEIVMSLEQISQLEQHEALIAARNNEIEAITESITNVSQIFKELAVLVIDQGTVLDRIDYNMENVANRTQAATRQLVQASNSQADTRPFKCTTALLFTITFLLFILVHKYI